MLANVLIFFKKEIAQLRNCGHEYGTESKQQTQAKKPWVCFNNFSLQPDYEKELIVKWDLSGHGKYVTENRHL